MSTDEAVTEELIETLEDGREGFAQGAEKLEGSDSPELAATFRRYSEQRAGFVQELRALAADYGDQVEESGTVAATLHRGWMSLKDALTGSDPTAVVKAAETGEAHAVSEYEKALKADLSAGLRTVVERQYGELQAAHQQVQALGNK